MTIPRLALAWLPVTLTLAVHAATGLPIAAAVGGTGGQVFSMQCSASERLGAVMVWSGARIDGLGIDCVPRGTSAVVSITRTGRGLSWTWEGRRQAAGRPPRPAPTL